MTKRLDGLYTDESASVTQASAHIAERSKAAGKRLFDIVFGLCMLVVFSPLMLLIAVMIRYNDGGPIIFAHTRIGRNGRQFKCLKFRTMVTNADERLEKILEESPEARSEWETFRKLKNDPRIIPHIGSRLRKSSLDELPQILNVIRGDMSIVGPRPVVSEELVQYGALASAYMQHRPGLTGPWQIGERSDTSFETRVKLDAQYMDSWTLIDDMRIAAKTAKMILSGRSNGAY